MKTQQVMKYRKIAGLILVMLLWSMHGSSQVYERSRHENRSFRVYERTSLEVYNKYGNIHLFTWEKDSVKIEVDLTVKASKESKADKMFEYIDFEFSDSKYYIIARTTFRQSQGSFWAELSDLANTMFSGGNKAQVDYNVYLPAGMSVKLENKFGNVYCTDHKGKFDVDLSNGDLKANNLTGPVELDLSFGNAGINHMESGKIKGSYLEMDLGSAVELFVESKSSTYTIEKAGVIKLQSRRDKFYIDEVSSVTGQTSFSYVTVKGFSRIMKLNTEYGEIKVRGIDPAFKSIELDSRYTDIAVQLQQQVSCKVDVQHSQATGIFFPDAFDGLKVLPPAEKDGMTTTSGFIGKEGQGAGEIRITIQSGKVTFQEEIQLF